MQTTKTHAYRTAGGIQIHRASIDVDYARATDALIAQLDAEPGVLLSSGCEVPGRYARWDLGFTAPPLRLSACGRNVRLQALNARGRVLLQLLRSAVVGCADFGVTGSADDCIVFTVLAAEPVELEEDRTRQRSVFTVLRLLLSLFRSSEDPYLGLYGAFGYELAFQFEAPRLRLPRDGSQRDLVLYLPDSLLVVDHRRETAQQLFYDFGGIVDAEELSTRDYPRTVVAERFHLSPLNCEVRSDHASGEYEQIVREALKYFARGDLFEAVPGQIFSQPCQDSPSHIFRRLQRQNPAPYGALMNLGEQEYLVSASPEMYVRVEGDRVETCPISGTIARGRDAMEDADNIRTLLNSAKDEAELSMCTDVDRNDKARVCRPGSIKVIGRRQIELYSRLIHTVDHVEGRLKDGYDAFDAFLSHAWAVTVTGAPKQAAIQFLEDHEKSPRAFYGGAIGALHFNGDLNTGLTLRTLHIRDGIANVRAGATLLFDSDPAAEEAETRLKASALLRALHPPAPEPVSGGVELLRDGFGGTSVLMVDHQDSFVHTLSSYLQETGARVRTVRPQGVAAQLAQQKPDLVVLSPGPGRPADFQLSETLRFCIERQIPVFGVCLGLQGIVEHFGGTLATLGYPMHGKPSELVQVEGWMFEGLSDGIRIGRYHSLVADRVPDCLQVTARTVDGQVMAVVHTSLPIAAVQFHPESILSLRGDAGGKLLRNVLQKLSRGGTK
ncbi:MAG TPA: anthranilate synthase component I [Candidatus Acidoferrum sp.]|nr:anthranilate synthase component I [Candidatus Acidoferrum sp.]